MNCSFDADWKLVEALEENCCPVINRSGCTLFHQSDTPTGIYLLLGGCVTLEMRSDDDRLLVSIDVFPTSILGLSSSLGNHHHRFSAIAPPGSQMDYVPGERFRHILRTRPALHPALLNAIAAEVCVVRQALAEQFQRSNRNPNVSVSKPIGAVWASRASGFLSSRRGVN